MVAPLPIHPPIHGAAVRITNLVQRLAVDHQLSLLLIAGGTDAPEHRQALVPPFREVFFHPVDDELWTDASERWPAMARPFASPALTDRVRALVHGHGFEIVQLEGTQLGGLVAACHPARVVLVEHDVSFESHARRHAAGLPPPTVTRGRPPAPPPDLAHLRRFELEACAEADQVHVMSDHDRDLLAGLLPTGRAALVVAPNGVDTRLFTPAGPPARRHGVLLLGSFPHQPNQDAFDWAVAEVWPAIRQRLPEATLTVAGARPPARVLEHDGRNGIRILGEVDDVRPLLRSHRVLLVPLRAGSGTRLKIIEAMACGLPVVSTTIGAEGLPCRPGTHLLVADDRESLARAVANIAADDNLAATLADAGRSLVESCLDWDDVAAGVDRSWRSLTQVKDVPTDTASSAVTRPRARRATPGPQPDVAVVIPVFEATDRLSEVCAAVEAQRKCGTVELLLVDARPDFPPSPARDGWRTVAAARPDSLGAALDTAMHATAAPAVAFLAADAVPNDHDWLRRLTTPLTADRPPAAVQGAIWEHIPGSDVRIDPEATRETRRWRANQGGLGFDLANAALHRKVWRQAPFGPWNRLPAWPWQRIASACQWLILPCWDAAVVRVRPAAAGWWWRETRHHGRDQRALGSRYRLTDAVIDLVWPRIVPHRHGWLPLIAATLRGGSTAAPWIRPLALLAARRPTGDTRTGYNADR